MEEKRLSLLSEGGTPHLAVHHRTTAVPFPNHWHSYFEIEIITGGKGMHSLNGHEYPVEAGSAYLLNPTDFHRLVPDADAPLMLWNISFDEEMLSERRRCQLIAPDVSRWYTLGEEERHSIDALAALLKSESQRPDGGCTVSLCECLITMLLRCNGEESPTESDHLSGIRRALSYMELHFRENPSLAQAAAQAGFHPHYFSQMFCRVTGMHYTEYLNSLRVSYARSLLSGGFSVTEACYQSGFGSLSNFLAVFKKSVGCTPDAYRHGCR